MNKTLDELWAEYRVAVHAVLDAKKQADRLWAMYQRDATPANYEAQRRAQDTWMRLMLERNRLFNVYCGAYDMRDH